MYDSPDRAWIDALNRWITSAGVSYSKVASCAQHDIKYVTSVFSTPGKSTGLCFFLDLARAAGASLDLAPQTTVRAVVSRLKAVARSRDITFASLGVTVGRDRSAISRLLNGRIRNPGLKLVAAITETLGLSKLVKFSSMDVCTTGAVHPATTYPAIVGQIIAASRHEKGLSQGQLAAKIGTNQSALSKIERGAMTLSIVQLASIAELLDTTPGRLITIADRAADYTERRGVRVEKEQGKSSLVFINRTSLARLVAEAICETS